jgi:hypothetical protein
VQDDVRAVLERPEPHRRGRRRVDDHARAARAGRRDLLLQVRKTEQRVRGRLEPDELAVLRRGAGLVELDEADAPALECPEEDARPVVGVVRERDRRLRFEQPQDECRRRA